MKQLYLILAISLLAVFSQAQPYGNEWIDYNRAYYKIRITEKGLYRISFATLAATSGINIGNLNGASVKLHRHGNLVPVYVSTQAQFGTNDFIEFYGEGNDGHFDTQLYADPDWQMVTDRNLFNDTAIYFLSFDATTPGSFMTSTPNNLNNMPAKEDYFIHRERQVYFTEGGGGIPYYVDNQPLTSSRFEKAEGFWGTNFNKTTRTYQLNTPHIYSSGPPAQVETGIVGISNTNHLITLQLNGSLNLVTDSYFGFDFKRYSGTIPLSALLATNNFVYGANGSASVDRIAVSYLDVTYPRLFNFGGNTDFYFQLLPGSGSRHIEVSGFNAQSSLPILYDLSNQLRLTGSTGGNPVFHLPAANIQSRFLYLTSEASITQVNSLERITFVNFNNQTQQGSFIILTTPHFLADASGTNWIEEYRRFRDQNYGGRFKAITVMADQLYDQFAYGIKKHPLAIGNFARFAVNAWNITPEYLFIIGKGQVYLNARYNSAVDAINFVPTYGHPGSDNLLTSTSASMEPLIPVGRLAALTPDDVRIYLEKIAEHERQQNLKGDPYQTTANKLWMKKILHLGGGANQNQQNTFKNYLDNYKRLVEDTSFGGNVESFFKTSSGPVQQIHSNYLRGMINNGVSLINFFGHSSPNSFDFSIDNPNTFNNEGRYHFILSNGCFSGNIFTSGRGISEDFVFAERKAAVGFLSTISLSVSSSLDIFSTRFYRNFGRNHYNEGVGRAIKQTIKEVEDCCPSIFNLMVASEMTLHGDPALRLNTHDYPDHCLEEQFVTFNPTVVSTDRDSFDIQIINFNIGKAKNDSISLRIIRQLPNGTLIPYEKRFRATYYSDTLVFTLPTERSDAFGLNIFEIKVDADDEVDPEHSETNNIIRVELNIIADDIFPIYPYEFHVVPHQDITLKASTADPFAPMRQYVLQIDTTEYFNSPVKMETRISQIGGVVEWTPQMTYMDSVVYYWRVSVDSIYGKPFNWHHTSFIYIQNEFPGWNQSHYFQYKKDKFTNLKLDNNRDFQFIDDLKEIKIDNGYLPYQQIGYFINGVAMDVVVCAGVQAHGIYIAVFDSVTGQPWASLDADRVGNYNTVHGNVHCKDRDLYAFQFITADSVNRQKVLDFMNLIPNGNYVIAYSLNHARWHLWEQALLDEFANLGSTQIFALADTNLQRPWAFFAKKGHSGTAVEVTGQSNLDVIQLLAGIETSWYEGELTSTLIGPAFEWGSFHWRNHSLEEPSNDETSIEIYGVNSNLSQTLLTTVTQARDTTLTWIDANQYPLLRLKFISRDDSTRTPSQLDYWRVLYKKVPEAALNAHRHFKVNQSDLSSGEPFEFEIAIENVTEIPMDSLLIKYVLRSPGRASEISCVREDSLRAFQWMIAKFTAQTDCNCRQGLNQFVIEANPDNDQPEQFHFNNIGQWQFKVTKDVVNPLLDVTFDGVHILDGEIVSSQPEILIRVKDENKFLAMDDTSLVQIWLEDPNGNKQRIILDGIMATFTPASPSQLAKNNTAQVMMNPDLNQDGVYKLHVRATDRSLNATGFYGNPGDGIDYRISFEVVNKASISYVVNYPNPFTSSTRFVFQLTGSEIPDYFKIQIMTISGKVVREITHDEIGPIRIGRNISDFAWNGTDQFGDPLANGLYLYRVVASIKGQKMEHYKTGADKFFKSGIGKMYLAR